LEVNTNPGGKIFHYLGLTENKKLDDFVKEENLAIYTKAKVISSHERSKVKIAKLIFNLKANGVATAEVEKKLGIDGEKLIGVKYKRYSKVIEPENEKQIPVTKLLETTQPFQDIYNFFNKSLLERYLEKNGLDKEKLKNRLIRETIISRIINRGRIKSQSSGINKSVEQGIVDSYNYLQEEFNLRLGANQGYNFFNTPSSAKELVSAGAELILKEALTAEKQIRVSKKYHQEAFNADDLEEKIELYTTAIQIDPNFLKAKGNLGLVYARKGDLEQARKTIFEVLSVDPNRKLARNVYERYLK